MMFYNIFIILIICSTIKVEARNIQDNSNNSDTNVYHKLKVIASSCQCINYCCSCCSHVEIAKINLNDTACVNLTYLSDEIGLRITFDVDNIVYYENSISLRNPPPLCFGVPYFKEGADICIKLYNITWQNSSYSGCVELVAYLLDVKVGQIKLGCFNFGNHTINHYEFEYSALSVHSSVENMTILKDEDKLKHMHEITLIKILIQKMLAKLFDFKNRIDSMENSILKSF